MRNIEEEPRIINYITDLQMEALANPTNPYNSKNLDQLAVFKNEAEELGGEAKLTHEGEL
jgi:hypothetical protein